mmetsp:Transcript_27301/g.68532  ORF Transcript_27301/g.68532 Transcript_27301/m.68532 type:complete len:265 (-) Transcript_27301:767-1561(-)
MVHATSIHPSSHAHQVQIHLATILDLVLCHHDHDLVPRVPGRTIPVHVHVHVHADVPPSQNRGFPQQRDHRSRRPGWCPRLGLRRQTPVHRRELDRPDGPDGSAHPPTARLDRSRVPGRWSTPVQTAPPSGHASSLPAQPQGRGSPAQPRGWSTPTPAWPAGGLAMRLAAGTEERPGPPRGLSTLGSRCSAVRAVPRPRCHSDWPRQQQKLHSRPAVAWAEDSSRWKTQRSLKTKTTMERRTKKIHHPQCRSTRAVQRSTRAWP